MKIDGAIRMPGGLSGLLALALCASPAAAAPNDEATARQKAAIQQVDDARQEFLKTGNAARFQSKLPQPARELSAGLDEFKRTQNTAALGVSLWKLGEIYRLQEEFPAASLHFLSAIAAAQLAVDKKTEASALIGAGRCQLVRKDYQSAATNFQEAAEVAAGLNDRAPLFNALFWEAQVEVQSGNLIGATDLLARAFALGPELQDQSLLLFVHLDRADVFEKLAEKSGATKAYSAQLESLEMARADYEAALKAARQFGYAGISPQIEQFLRHLTTRRQMVEMNVRFAKTLAQSSVFLPKKPGDVLVNEEFVPGQVDLPARLIGLLQQGGILEGGDARGFVTRGQFHAMEGDADEALADYLKAADALEVDRRNLRDNQSREKFFNDKIAFYYPAISQLLERKRFAEAFGLMERSRSRAMADLIFSKKLALAQPNEQALFGEAQRLRAEIAALQK